MKKTIEVSQIRNIEDDGRDEYVAKYRENTCTWTGGDTFHGNYVDEKVQTIARSDDFDTVNAAATAFAQENNIPCIYSRKLDTDCEFETYKSYWEQDWSEAEKQAAAEQGNNSTV